MEADWGLEASRNKEKMMDLLKRDLAPISNKAWEEIDTLAKETLSASLSARKFLDVSGPHGVSHTSVNIGKLHVPKNQKSDVLYGVYSVQPLVETRIRFSLPTWELDNIERGAKDADLDSLVDAAKKVAAFEEQAVYFGFEEACMAGLTQIAEKSSIETDLTQDGVIDAVSACMTQLISEGIDAPANLIAGPKLWNFLARSAPGGSLKSQIERQISGKVIFAPSIESGFLAADRGGDFELVIGQDFAIGYHSHTTEKVELFLMESFAFRVITPEAVAGLNIR